MYMHAICIMHYVCDNMRTLCARVSRALVVYVYVCLCMAVCVERAREANTSNKWRDYGAIT